MCEVYVCTRLLALFRLHCEMGVHPAATERHEDTEPFTGRKDLALAVPSNGENHDSLQMTDNVESQSGGAADDQKLRQVVQGGHDARSAYGVKYVGRDEAQIWDLVEEWDEGNQEEHRDGGLVQEQLRG